VTELSLPQVKSPLFSLPNLDRIIRGLLLVFIFSLPFKGLLFVERNGFIILLVMLGLWCTVHRGVFFRSTPIDLPLVAFALWVAITIPFATYPLYSLKEFGKLLQQGLVFYTVVFFFQDKTSRALLIRFLVGASLIVSFYGLTQFDWTDIQSVMSFLPAEVWLTTYLIMLIPLCFALAWYEERSWVKGFYSLGVLLPTCCLFLTRSRAGLLAFLVELWALAYLLRHRAMLIAASMSSLAVLLAGVMFIKVATAPDGALYLESRAGAAFNTNVKSIVHRFDIWAFSLEQMVERPVMGIGYGKETAKMLFGQVPEEVQPGHEPVRQQGTHNILLELGLHVGLPGLMLFVWLAICLGRTIIAGFRQVTDLWEKAILLGASVSFIGLAVRLQFDQMLVGSLAMQFWILMALAIISRDSLSEKFSPVVGDDRRDVHEPMTA